MLLSTDINQAETTLVSREKEGIGFQWREHARHHKLVDDGFQFLQNILGESNNTDDMPEFGEDHGVGNICFTIQGDLSCSIDPCHCGDLTSELGDIDVTLMSSKPDGIPKVFNIACGVAVVPLNSSKKHELPFY